MLPMTSKAGPLLARVVLILVAVGGGLGCGADETSLDETSCGASAPQQLCNGSQDRRLSVVVAASPGSLGGDQIILYENGARFIHVQGDCRYWVSKGYGRYHTGLLAESEVELKNALFYGQWSNKCLTKSWGPPEGLFHAATTMFSDGTDRVAISYAGPPAKIPGAPPEVYSMWQAENAWVERLWAAGSAVQGPIRMLVIDDPSVRGRPVVMWPLSWRLESVAVPVDQVSALGPGQGNVLITDPSEVEKIVAIWEQFLSGQHGSLGQCCMIVFQDASKQYMVVIRDTIPLEDEMGRIPPL